MRQYSGGGVCSLAPLGHPVVGNERVSAWEEFFKHLSIVISLLRGRDHTLEPLGCLGQHGVADLREEVGREGEREFIVKCGQ